MELCERCNGLKPVNGALDVATEAGMGSDDCLSGVSGERGVGPGDEGCLSS